MPIQLGPEGKFLLSHSPNPYQVIFLNSGTLTNAAQATSRFSQMIQDGKEKVLSRD